MENQGNPLPPTVKEDKKVSKEFRTDFLSKKEIEHDSFVKERMITARDDRNASRDEWDGMTYLNAYDRDTKSSLAFISPVKNNGESPVSTGTTRQSLMSLISRAMSYNYETEFRVFDKNNNELVVVAHGIEVAVAHANFLDNEDDQISERINELLAHGDVLVWEDWVTEYGLKKSHPAFDGKIKGVNWTKRKAKIFEGCRRRTVQGKRFYPGSIFVNSIDKQPFCYEVNHITYAEAKLKYGTWERWKNVPNSSPDNEFDDWSSYAEDWHVEKGPNGTIQEIIYVDKPNNEMQIQLQGVPMLPAGFPMKWEHEKYPWGHQGAEPLRTGFFYHRSFVRTLLNMQDIENDMWRVLIMLAWKAALPTLANQTGQVITRRDVMPGQIVDVDAEFLKPIEDGSMQNTGFVRDVISMIRDNMTSRSVPESKQGIDVGGDPTATQVTQLNNEAEIAISMNLSAIGHITAKIDWLRAGNILQHAFKKGFKASAELPGKGGVVKHIVELVDEPLTSREIARKEDGMEKESGVKSKIIQLRGDIKNIIDRMYARPVPKPRSSSALDKVEMMNMFQAASAVFGPNFNPEFFEDSFRRAYQIPANVRLTKEMPANMQQEGSKPKAAPPLPNQLVNNTPPV